MRWRARSARSSCDLRRLEVERDLRLEQARQADEQVQAVGRQIAETTVRQKQAEAAIEAARPALEARLVETYKLGRPGYARLILSVESLKDAARASRMAIAMAQLDHRRVADFQSALARLEAETASLGRQSAELKAAQSAAREASVQAQRATLSRALLIREIDERRDLNVKMVTELEGIRDRLTKTVASLPTTSAEDPTMLPLRPFRGALDWPVAGRIVSRFGERRNPRFGTTIVQNGIEVETGDQARRAGHPRGTRGVCRAASPVSASSSSWTTATWPTRSTATCRRSPSSRASGSRAVSPSGPPAGRRPATPLCTSSYESTPSRSIPYNGSRRNNQ